MTSRPSVPDLVFSDTAAAPPDTPQPSSAVPADSPKPAPAKPTLTGMLDALLADPALSDAIAVSDGASVDLTAPAPLHAFIVAAAARRGAEAGDTATGTPVLAVTATTRDAEDLVGALGAFLPADSVAMFPSWETLPHERLSPRADTVGRRLAVLRQLTHPEEHGTLRVVVAPVRSVLQPQVRGLGDLRPVHLEKGQEVPLDDVVRALADAAYARVELVEKRGEFAVRGGILDVFPPTEEHPIRVEFWGDEVDELRYFAVADQRSLGTRPETLWAPPCRELLLTPEVRERARLLAVEHPELAEMLDQIADGTPVEGMEALVPVLVESPDDLRLLVQEMPAGTHVVVCDPERVRTRAAEMVRTSAEFLEASWAAAAAGGNVPVDLGAAAYRDLVDVEDAAREAGLGWWRVTPFADNPDSTGVVDARPVEPYVGDIDRALVDFRELTRDGWRIGLVFAGHGPAQRAVERLAEAEVPVRGVPEIDAVPDTGFVYVTTAQLEHGFASESLKLALVTESDLTGGRGVSTKDMRKMPSRRRNAIDLLQLQPGDYVVHEQHGVARYVEMVRRTVNGGEREYLILEYASSKRGQPADRLFVPSDALDQVTRYVGGEQPTLSKLGGSDWAKTKGRARKAVREIAAELIRLYAARTSTPGHAFGPDTPWQRELEDAFPYVETPDQLAAIEEVKADMERTVPMDRVICGDVGYGKTEIAVRAAFKAVQDGKQVAILVPTTLLAQQHFSTFSERMAQFPVSVKVLSRFQSPLESEQVVAGIADGTVDIAIGTHRLLQASTRFKNLGLVIVDEEQRFGVEHKEYLKQMRTAVDVLTMSATPIPRTLEMSLTGIREMSTILTPPEERHPVLTFVGAYDDKQLTAALHRELLRDGQVFYLHNRVSSIEKTAARIRELVPEARVAVGHGQMNEEQLEKVMVGFWERDYDVLVATTIVEAGLDIPNANTLIVERADLLGLSQLHQIRGRVGRGRERAYAYFLYPPEKPLTETAYDRLATIAQNSDLGAGMAVAMKDLEIRGAGNLLGGEQSGHVAGVGFDLYVRLVGEAVAEYRGEKPTEEAVDVRVDLPINAHVPDGYVPTDRLRLEAYRKLAGVTDDAGAEAIKAELADRYGPLPESVENLLHVAKLRGFAREHGVTEISLQGNQVRFSPIQLKESQQMRLSRLYPRSVYKSTVGTISIPKPTETGSMGSPGLRDKALLDWCHQVLESLEAPAPAVAK